MKTSLKLVAAALFLLVWLGLDDITNTATAPSSSVVVAFN